MNFVGSEVRVSSSNAPGGMHHHHSPHHPFGTGSDENDDDHDCIEDLHPPISPKGGAESLFLADLDTQQISAYALAQQIHEQFRLDSTTVATEDYVTAAASSVGDDDNNDLFFFSSTHAADNHYNSNHSPFGKDALALSRELSADSPYEARYHDTTTMNTPLTINNNNSTKTDAAE